MAKKSYTVCGFVTVPVGFHVEVEADSKEQAEELALKELLENRDYTISDFDGNSVDFGEDDIEITATDEE